MATRTTPEQHRAHERAYRLRHPERYALKQWRHKIKRVYGITPEDYEVLMEAQGRVCALCARDNRGKRLAVDHCKETGEVRGLLCTPCNRAIAQLGDDQEGLLWALAYLKRGA